MCLGTIYSELQYMEVNMASNGNISNGHEKNIEAAEGTYSSFLSYFRTGAIITATIAALVIFVIS